MTSLACSPSVVAFAIGVLLMGAEARAQTAPDDLETPAPLGETTDYFEEAADDEDDKPPGDKSDDGDAALPLPAPDSSVAPSDAKRSGADLPTTETPATGAQPPSKGEPKRAAPAQEKAPPSLDAPAPQRARAPEPGRRAEADTTAETELPPAFIAAVSSSVGLALGLAAPVAITGIGALAFLNAASGNQDPSEACGSAILSLLAIGCGVVTAGPLGLCGSFAGSSFYVLSTDRSFLGPAIGLGVGIGGLIVGGGALAVGANFIDDADQLTSVLAIGVPGLLFAAAGVWATVAMIATTYLESGAEAQQASGGAQRQPVAVRTAQSKPRPDRSLPQRF